MPRLERILKSGVFLLLLLACTIVMIGTAETTDVSHIDVTGRGTVQAVPDQVEISLAVITMGTDIEEIQRENAEKMTSVLSALRSDLGLSDSEISTSYYSLYEERYPSDAMKAMYGDDALIYRVSNTIYVITSDVDSAGAIIDVAVLSGANSVTSLQFTLTDELRRQHQAQALEMAVEKATDEAKIVASALGMQLGKAVYAQVGGSSITPYMLSGDRAMGYAKSVSYDSAAPTPIQAEDVEVSASVSISFAIT